jgi:GNAT superfamily N-acetyltransferase
LVNISAPGQDGYEDLVRMGRRMRVRRELTEQYLSEGSIGVMAYVLQDGKRHAAGMGWVTQHPADVPFLNARFNGAGRSCMLYQDFVLPDFRGRQLQRVLGKHRMMLAAQNGAHWAYGYIRRANPYSLRNAITYQTFAIVHNLHFGEWATAHVCTVGKRTCADLPFDGWPPRRWFYIKPRRD